MSKPTPGAVVFVSDVRRLSTFYRELAAMTVLVDEEDHCVLETDGFQLVVHGLSGEPGAPQDAEVHVRIREDSYVKLCLPVESIASARVIAARYGGAIKPAQYEWEARGFRACDGHDPEGNVIQVRENAG